MPSLPLLCAGLAFLVGLNSLLSYHVVKRARNHKAMLITVIWIFPIFGSVLALVGTSSAPASPYPLAGSPSHTPGTLLELPENHDSGAPD